MAYAVTGNTTPVYRKDDVGRYYAHWTIVETDVSANSEYSISLAGLKEKHGAIEQFTMTEFLSTLTTAGTAATIQPKWGRATNPTAGNNDYITQASAAGTNIAARSDMRFTIAGDNIYFRTTPNAGTATRVDTEITIRTGH